MFYLNIFPNRTPIPTQEEIKRDIQLKQIQARLAAKGKANISLANTPPVESVKENTIETAPDPQDIQSISLANTLYTNAKKEKITKSVQDIQDILSTSTANTLYTNAEKEKTIKSAQDI